MTSTHTNIILIILDTHRVDRLGAYGYTRPTSPNLDQFARSAITFERAIAPAQWTIPSHASMFSGLPPSTHQTVQANSMFDPRFVTFADLLSAAGYETLGFCNNPLLGIINNNLKQGFQSFYNYSGTLPDIPRDFPNSSVYPFMRIWGHLEEAVRKVVTPIQNKFSTNNSLLQAATNPIFVPLWTRLVHFKGNTARSIRDVTRTLANKTQRGSQRPYMLLLNLMETHLPFMPPAEYVNRFAPYLREDRQASNFMKHFNRQAMHWLIPLKKPFTESEARTVSDLYDAEVAYQDHLLGQLLEQLDRPAMRDNSLVIITADHGEMLGEHQFMGHGFGVYKELIQVPLMIRLPGQHVGQRVSQPVQTMRLFHTILDAAGITGASSHNHLQADVSRYSLLAQSDGLSTPVISEAYPPSDALAMMERAEPELIERFHMRQPHRAVYSAEHKLYDIEGVSSRLLTHDDNEQDRALDALTAEQREQMVTALAENLARFVQSSRDGQPEGWVPPLADLSDPFIEQRLRDLGYMT